MRAATLFRSAGRQKPTGFNPSRWLTGKKEFAIHIRDTDGLAMSLRNMYLTAERTCLYQALTASRQRVKDGETAAEALIRSAAAIINAHFDTTIDYIAICDPPTLNDVPVVNGPVFMAMAVKVGETRLIDNMMLSL